MADSISKQILLAIVAKLTTGAPAGLAVNRGRTVATSEGELPMLSIYRIEETPTMIGNPRQPMLAQRHLIVEMVIESMGDDDACDPYQDWVISQMASDQKIGGLAKSVIEIKTAWNPEEGSDGSSMTTFLRYRVEYFTTPGDITKTIPAPGR